MILCAKKIAQLLKQGIELDTTDPLLITPTPDITTLKKSGSASVDLRLGTWFMSLRPARMESLKIEETTKEPKLTKYHYVPFDSNFYLHPGNFVLGTTLEWIRLPKTLAGYVVGKSSWGRRGLIIATATGVHPGFTGCLTLEISNVGEIPIELRPGIHICQLFLHNIESKGVDNIDSSFFIGRRRPTLGQISLDNFAKKLSQQFDST
jgi:dCTP deaminase